VLNLQHAIGNQAVLQLMRTEAVHAASGARVEETKLADRALSPLRPLAVVQPKLAINAPRDAYEQEADCVADQVMRRPQPEMSTAMLSGASPPVQRNCDCGGSCAKCRGEDEHAAAEAKPLETKSVIASSAVPTEAPASVHEVLKSPGQPLDATTRAFMEPRFGRNFARVRVHVDDAASKSAAAVGARAYTLGQHVVFGRGGFDSGSAKGRRLIGHELAHTIQQRGPGSEAVGQAPHREQEADHAANQVLAGGPVPTLTPSGVALARQPSADNPVKSEPEACQALGKLAATPATIDAQLTQIEIVKSQLLMASIMPGPVTYEVIAPQLHVLDLQRLQLLRCAASRGSAVKQSSASAQPGDPGARQAQKAQELLNEEAVRLAGKQAQRHEFWDALEKAGGMASFIRRTKEYRKKLIELDLQEEAHFVFTGRGGKENTTIVRDPFVSVLEDELKKNREAGDVYGRTLWDLMENKPEEESWFHKGMSVICEHTVPCVNTMDRLHACLDRGMSRKDCQAYALGGLAIDLAPVGAPQDVVPLGPGRPVPFGVPGPPVPEPRGMRPGLPPEPMLPSPSKPMHAEPVKPPVSEPPRTATRALEFERGRRKPSAQEIKGGPSTLSEHIEELGDVPTKQEKLTTRRKGEKPLTESTLKTRAGEEMENQAIQWLKKGVEGPGVKVLANKELPPNLRAAYIREGVKGPDAIIVDATNKKLTVVDSTTKSGTQHEAKTNRDTRILKQNLPKEYRDKNFTVDTPFEIHTDSTTGEFTLSRGPSGPPPKRR
jgi:hypothetical protein